MDWEFPAKAFTVSVSTDGVKWSEVFATDSNVLSSSSIALGAVPAAKVRVTMREASHPASRHFNSRGQVAGLAWLIGFMLRSWVGLALLMSWWVGSGIDCWTL